MKLISLIITIFILSIIIINSTIILKNTSISTKYNTQKDEISKIVHKKFIELKTKPIKNNFIDTIYVLNNPYVCEYIIQKNKISATVKDIKNKIVLIIHNNI